MRPILAAALSVASLTAASAGAQSEPRRTLSPIRMVYTRPLSCPDEQELADAIAERLHARPFAPSAPSRLLVTLRRTGARYEGTATLHDASDGVVWSVAVPPMSRDCSSVMDSLAFDIAFALAPKRPAAPAAPAPPPPPSPPSSPVAPPARPPTALAAPAPTPPPAVVAPLAPTAQPVNPPEPPSVPNPTRRMISRVAIVSYASGAVFLGLGIAWSVHAQSKAHTAQALSSQPDPVSTDSGCTSAGAPGRYCGDLLGAWQSRDAALNLRNGWFAAAGISVAVGAVATAWALNLPTTITGQPQTKLTIRPGGLVFSGTF